MSTMKTLNPEIFLEASKNTVEHFPSLQICKHLQTSGCLPTFSPRMSCAKSILKKGIVLLMTTSSSARKVPHCVVKVQRHFMTERCKMTTLDDIYLRMRSFSLCHTLPRSSLPQLRPFSA